MDIIDASKSGDFKKVQELLRDPKVDPSVQNNIAIAWASLKGHTDIVKFLLKDHRVDPSDDSNDAILAASTNGHIGVVRALLHDPRVDPSDMENMPIINASKNGHTEIVEILLLDNRVNPIYGAGEAIREASKNNHQEIVELLLNDKRMYKKGYLIFSALPAFNHENMEIVNYVLKNFQMDIKENFKSMLIIGNNIGEENYIDFIKYIFKDPTLNIKPEDLVHMSNSSHELNKDEIAELLMEYLSLYVKLENFIKSDYSTPDYHKLLKEIEDCHGLGYKILLEEGERRLKIMEKLKESNLSVSEDILWEMTKF